MPDEAPATPEASPPSSPPAVSKWPARVLRVIIAATICAASLAGLHFSTRNYKVFSNDFPLVLQVVAGAVILALCLLITFAGLRKLRTYGLLLALFLALLFCRHQMISIRLSLCTASCANHSGVWWQHTDNYDFAKPLPASTEFHDLLKAFWGDNLVLSMARCPGYRRTGTATGVVFVGGGLRLSSLPDKKVLIAFCSWKSHPPPYDHQHCLLWNGDVDRECTRTWNTIELIEKAIAQAKSGEVPYSPEAVQILQYELDQRRQLRH
jgi:hypothetical protein